MFSKRAHVGTLQWLYIEYMPIGGHFVYTRHEQNGLNFPIFQLFQLINREDELLAGYYTYNISFNNYKTLESLFYYRISECQDICTGFEFFQVSASRVLNFFRVCWTGLENFGNFSTEFTDPVPPVNNERSLSFVRFKVLH